VTGHDVTSGRGSQGSLAVGEPFSGYTFVIAEIVPLLLNLY
jgi:hypothetical protein